MVYSSQAILLLVSFFSLFVANPLQVKGQRDASDSERTLELFQAPSAGSDACNCMGFNDILCRGCYDSTIKCNKVCANQCCQMSTFNPDGKKKPAETKPKTHVQKPKPEKPKPKKSHTQHHQSYSMSHRYRGRGRHHVRGHRMSFSMSHSMSVRYSGRQHHSRGGHHISAAENYVHQVSSEDDYTHQVSEHIIPAGRRGRVLRWTPREELPKRIRSS